MTGHKSRPRRCLKRSLLALVVGAFAIAPMAAFADSTTYTAFTVQGPAVPGKQVTVHVTVTGKHLVFVPPNSVYGGNVQVLVQGVVVSSTMAALPNSSGISAGQCIPDPTFSFCQTYKYPAQQTDVVVPVTVPTGVTTFQVSARYTGDADSHSSDATPVTVKASYPDVTPSLQLLLD